MPNLPQIPQTCAVFQNQDSKGPWLRGIITEVAGLFRVKVFLIDIGDKVTVELSQVRYLLEHFGSLPGQAILARCAGIVPTNKKWSSLASNDFVKLINDAGKDGICSVYKGRQRLMVCPIQSPRFPGKINTMFFQMDKISLTLIDTCSNDLEDGININAKMVELGHATYDLPGNDNVDSLRIASINATQVEKPVPGLQQSLDLPVICGKQVTSVIPGRKLCLDDFAVENSLELLMRRHRSTEH